MTAEPDRFVSIGALQEAHLALRAAVDTVDGPDAPPGAALRREILLLRRRVRVFERRAAATGALLDDRTDRDMVQSLLDFWSIRQAYLQRTATRLRASDPARGARRGGSGTGLAVPDTFPLAPFDEASAPALPDDASPFIGLNAFGEAEASRAFFQGRGDAVVELAQTVAAHRLVVVAGASGSGKSSLVMAGLLPALRKGAIEGSATWRYWPAVLPGTDPVAALLQAIRPPGREAAEWVAEQRPALTAKPDSLPALLALTPPDTQPSLLIVDQTEELVSLSKDLAAREAFAAAVIAASRAATPHHVVIVVREDFILRLRAIEAFAAVPEDAFTFFLPNPMTSAELTLAIEEPARRVGLKFDPGIVDDLVRQVVNDPAALPMLQFTLTQLWRHRQRNRITEAAYRDVGRPREALQRTADRVYADLRTQQSQDAAKAIFQTLVEHSVGNEYVRRPVRRETLHQLSATDRIDRVLAAFVDAGLVRRTPGIVAADDRFDVMHEALLRNWPELAGWLEQSRQASLREQQVLARAQGWRDSNGQADHLARGAALQEAENFIGKSALIGDYVMASRDAEHARRAEERSTEAAVAKSERARARLRVAALTIVALAAATIAFFLYLSAREARSNAAQYAERARINEAAAQKLAQIERKNEAAARTLTSIKQELANVEQLVADAEKDQPIASISENLPATVRERPGVDGFLWVGTDRQSYIRTAQTGTLALPSKVQSGRLYRLRVNLALRNGWPPDGAYKSPPTLFPGARGSAGALIESRGSKVFPRPSGQQVWLKVRLVPQIYLQFPGDAKARIDDLTKNLIEMGYDVPSPEAKPVSRGFREIRYYHEQDRVPAEALARDVATFLGFAAPVKVNPMKGFAKRGDPGKIEAWIDPRP